MDLVVKMKFGSHLYGTDTDYWDHFLCETPLLSRFGGGGNR